MAEFDQTTLKPISQEQRIVYGDFEFEFNTLRLDHTNTYSDDGGIQYTEVTATITGVLYEKLDTYLETISLASEISTMRRNLSQARQRFTVFHGTERIFDWQPEDDDEWGPRPNTFNITQMAGGMAAWYEAVIVMREKYCYTSSYIGEIQSYTKVNPLRGTDLEGVTQNVRTYRYAVDQNGACTRTTSGTIRCIDSRAPADNFLPYVIPGEIEGFTRTGIDRDLSADGLTCNWSVVDEEQKAAFPDPVTSGSAIFITSTETFALQKAQLTGSFECPPTLDKIQILQKITELVDYKFQLRTNHPYIMKKSEIREDLFHNKLEFSFEGERGWVGSVDLAGLTDLDLLPEDWVRNNPLPPYGVSGIANTHPGPLECTPQSPRSVPNKDSSGSIEGSTTRQKSALPIAVNVASDEHIAGPYLSYTEVVSYSINHNKKVMYPRNQDEEPVTISLGPKKLRVTQRGNYVRIGKANQAPVLPQPIVTGEILFSDFTLGAPSPLDGGKWRYEVSYLYVIEVARKLSSTISDEMKYPTDRRAKNKPDEDQVAFQSSPGNSEFDSYFA